MYHTYICESESTARKRGGGKNRTQTSRSHTVPLAPPPIRQYNSTKPPGTILFALKHELTGARQRKTHTHAKADRWM